MLIVIDDVVSNTSFQSDCIKLSETEKNIPEKWYSLDEEHLFQNFCIQMINVASQMYDFTSCIGYEFWTHYNTRPRDWHMLINYWVVICMLKMILLHQDQID